MSRMFLERAKGRDPIFSLSSHNARAVGFLTREAPTSAARE